MTMKNSGDKQMIKKKMIKKWQWKIKVIKNDLKKMIKKKW